MKLNRKTLRKLILKEMSASGISTTPRYIANIIVRKGDQYHEEDTPGEFDEYAYLVEIVVALFDLDESGNQYVDEQGQPEYNNQLIDVSRGTARDHYEPYLNLGQNYSAEQLQEFQSDATNHNFFEMLKDAFYDGPEELSNMKELDFHPADQALIQKARTEYVALISSRDLSPDPRGERDDYDGYY